VPVNTLGPGPRDLGTGRSRVHVTLYTKDLGTMAGHEYRSAATTTAVAWGEGFSAPGFEEPVVFWVPAIAISGLSFYDGDKFPAWKGNAFVGGMRANTGQHIQRVQFNAKGLPTGREIFLSELKQRIREVKPGADGYLYVLTDETFGAILRVEPPSN
jgi:glucose/arabinose dehydrogenase